MLLEWRGALFRVRLARMRLGAQAGAVREPVPEGFPLLAAIATALTLAGVAAFAVGALMVDLAGVGDRARARRRGLPGLPAVTPARPTVLLLKWETSGDEGQAGRSVSHDRLRDSAGGPGGSSSARSTRSRGLGRCRRRGLDPGERLLAPEQLDALEEAG